MGQRDEVLNQCLNKLEDRAREMVQMRYGSSGSVKPMSVRSSRANDCSFDRL